MSDAIADLKRAMRDVAQFDRILRTCGPSMVSDLVRKHPELRAVRNQWIAVWVSFDGARP